MSAPANDVNHLKCVSSEATFTTVRRHQGEPVHDVLLAEEEGVAVVCQHGSDAWVQVYLSDLDFDDSDDFDAVISAVVEHAFGPIRVSR